MSKITTPERLLLPRLATNPEAGITIKSLSAIIHLTPQRTGGILKSLVDKGFVGHSENKWGRKYWRLKEIPNGVTKIQSGPALDDAIATLQAQAARVRELEELIHGILNLLANSGFYCPQLEKEETTND